MRSHGWIAQEAKRAHAEARTGAGMGVRGILENTGKIVAVVLTSFIEGLFLCKAPFLGEPAIFFLPHEFMYRPYSSILVSFIL